MADTGLEQEQLVATSSSSAVDIRQLLKILHRRRFLIASISCLVMSAAGVLALLAKPNYQSSMQMLVSSNIYESTRSRNSPGDGDSDFTDANLEVVDYTAQLQLMLSNQLIEKAVAKLRSEYPQIKVEDIKGEKNKKGKKPPLSVARVESGSGINRIPSQVFEITYKDKNPIKTQQVLEALKQVYQDYNIEQQKLRLSRGMAFVNERLPKVKSEVTQAERNLELFRNRNKILDPEAQSKILLASLADTQKQLQTTQAQLQDSQARYTAIQQKLAASPRSALVSSRLSQSTRYQTLLNEIQKTELAISQERIRYTDNSPAVQKLLEQRQSQLSLLRQEVGRSLSDQVGKSTSPPSSSAIDSTIEKILNQSLNQPLNPPANNNESLLGKGQLAGVDLKLVEEMIQVQTTALGLIANQQSLTESEKRLRTELSRYPSLIAEYNRLLPEVQTSRKTLEQLMQAQQSLGLKIAQGGFDWQIIEAPEKGTYIGSGRMILLGGGLLLGPILAIVIALILELLNDKLYVPYELQRITNLRLLGIVPKLLPPKKPKRTIPVFKNTNNSRTQNTRTLVIDSPVTMASLPSHETIDMAYQNIQILNSPLPYKSLMVTSAQVGEGKSTVALGLAVSAARMHHRVLIIDANLRNPSLHEQLDLSNDWGLSLLLVDEANPPYKEYIQPVHPAIDILTAGPFPEDAVQLLSSRQMRELLEYFEQIYDLVLVDASPILGTVDARILATLCDAIVLVARMGQVTRTEVVEAKEILEKLNLVGIIANQPKKFD
ncbi:lipopolysaccharide biosynthesis protein [Calothrix sp. NIES-4101]|nr:lipopolysaccharide biosynthesis protein [Calothrix sp. NIES-4101]